MTRLIFPLVSAGNVPQLAVDLVLHNPSSNFKFVKDLPSQYLLYPFVGSLDKSKTCSKDNQKSKLYQGSNDKKFSSALELFYDEKNQIYIVQQRTPIITSFENNFFHELISNDLKACGIEEIIVLDSSGPLELENIVNYNNINSQFFIHNDRIAVGHVDVMLEKLSSYMESKNLLLSSSKVSNSDSTAFSENYINNEPIIDSTLLSFDEKSFQVGLNTNGQSFKFLYHVLHHNASTKVEYVNMLVYEGDNSHDAGVLVKNLFVNDQIQNKLPTRLIDYGNLVPPLSWDGVYGFNSLSGSIDEGLYI